MVFAPFKEELGNGTTSDGFTGYHSAVLDMCSGKYPKHKVKRREVQFLYFPIKNRGIPSMAELKEIVARLEKEVKAGHTLYIHCWGGRGRAGTIGACLIGKLEGLSLSGPSALSYLYRTPSAIQSDWEALSRPFSHPHR